MDPRPGPGPVPAFQMSILLLQRYELKPFQCVILCVLYAGFRLPFVFGCSGKTRQRDKTGMFAELLIHQIELRLEDICGKNAKFEIVQPDCFRYTAKCFERMLMATNEGLHILVLHHFFIGMA